jgi:secreted trypsin-like serine protease
MRRTLSALAVGVAALALAAGTAGSIVGGQLDGTRHSSTAALVGTSPFTGQTGAYCSGVLVSPTVLVTAAHCDIGTPTVQVTFDPAYTSSSKLYSGTFTASPSADLAVVVFSKPIKEITPARLPTASLLDHMKADGTLTQATQFTSVGYGDQGYTNGGGGQVSTNDEARRYAVGSFNSLSSSELHLSQNPSHGDAGTCSGDSGGPTLLGAGSTETNTVVAITVSGDTYCNSTNVGLRLDTATARAFLGRYVTLP